MWMETGPRTKAAARAGGAPVRHRIGRVLAAVLALLVALASLPPGAWAEKPSGGHGRVDRYLREKAAREPHARVPVLIQRTNRVARPRT